MKKSLKYSLIGLGAIIILGFLGVSFFLDSIVKSGIEEVGTRMSGTQVTVESVALSPFSGSGTVEELKVDNPEGFESEHAIVIQSFDVSVDVASLLSDKMVVNEVTVTEPAISVIQKVPENNLKMLMNNLEEAMAAGSSSSKTLVIKHLLVKDGRISVSPNIGADQVATVQMSDMELHNIGAEGSSSVEKVVTEIASKIVDEALSNALTGELDDLKNKAKGAVKDIFN